MELYLYLVSTPKIKKEVTTFTYILLTYLSFTLLRATNDNQFIFIFLMFSYIYVNVKLVEINIGHGHEKAHVNLFFLYPCW
jgi:hypothetical protein